MRARLAALGVPSCIIALAFGGSYWASKAGMIPPAVGFYLWPALVAAALLALTLAALMLGARRPLWPLGVGFVAQLVGILLLWLKVLDNGWQVLFYTLGAIAVVLVVMGIVWLIVLLRTRWLERKMLEGLGDGGGSEQELDRIRKDMREALELLRKAGRGSHAIYTLPWFLVLGRPQAGKTVAIKNSGLGLPVRKDWVKGVGGTHTCDWFFTNEMIFLDTPGRWVTDGAGAKDQSYWNELLKLLRKYRGRQPLDGLVVVVPADDLLGKSREELLDQAGKIREVLDLMHDQLRFRFPVYLAISKTDLVSGFTDFFRGLPAQRRHEIMGWSDTDPGRGRPGDLVREGFARVVQRLGAYRVEMMAKVGSRRRARRLFFFTEEFQRLGEPLAEFVEVLLKQDRYHEPPVFRGFYFTSGTQGEGSPLSQAMSELARSLGVTSQAVASEEEEEAKRSYFLLDLFRDLMVGDEGLVSRTTLDWLRRRRDTMLVAFLPAAIALLVLVLSVFSLLMNSVAYGRIESEAPRIVSRLDEAGNDRGRGAVVAKLELTAELQDHHSRLTGFTLLRGWGMRRPGELADHSLQVFRDRFRHDVLEPTLSRAAQLAMDASQSCLGRIDVMHSVVWLRMGRRAQWSEDMAGFDRVWGLTDEEARSARDDLLGQFGYLKDRVPRGDRSTLLPGFPIARVAESIARDCSAQGSTSALEAYRQFQENCRDAVSPAQIRECYARLGEVLRYEEQDFERFVSHFRDLKEDLGELAGVEPEAARGLEVLGAIDLAEVETGECLTRFTSSVLPEIRAYAEDSEDLIEPCKTEVDAVIDRGRRFLVRDEVLRAQAETLEGTEEDLRSLLRTYSEQCRGTLPGLRRLEFDVLGRVVPAYRRVACLETGEDGDLDDGLRPTRVSLRYIQTPSPVSGRYQRAGLESRRQEWQMRLEAEEGYDQAQRRYEIETVRGEVEAYAEEYADAWISYLRGLSMKRRGGSVSGWLKALSTTTDFVEAIRPAASAASAASSMTESPLDTFGPRLGSLNRLPGFVSGDLPQYQNLLGQIARDLEKCERDPGHWLSYRRAVSARREGNALVNAIAWVDLKASSGLADGALRRLLRQPLDQAESYVRSDNLAQRQWSDVRSAHAAVGEKYPFAGSDLAEAAPLDEVVALLGGASGAVIRFEAAASTATLGPETEAWVRRAGALSRALFDEGSDVPKPVKLRITTLDPSFDPEDLGEKVRLDEIQLYFGEDADLRHKEGDPPRRTFDIELLGDSGSRYSYAGAIPEARKGFFGRLFGADWEEGKTQQATTAEGAWAPMRLVSAGLVGGVSDDATRADVTYPLEVPMRRDRVGRVGLRFTVEGEDLGLLLSVVRSGLGAPPAEMGR